MKLLYALLILTFGFSLSSFSQELKFKVKGVEDGEVNLVKYVGKKLYYADTANLVNGEVIFDGSKQEPGVMALFFPNQKYFEFIYNNEKVNIETKAPDFIDNMVVKESKENTIFLNYIRHLNKQRAAVQKMQEELKQLDDTESEKITALRERIDKVGEEVYAYQVQTASDNANTLAGKIIRLSTDIKIPETPKELEGPQKDNFPYEYLRDHYFDNIDLNDDRLVNTPVIQNKLEYFYSDRMLMQQPDTLVKYLFRVVDKVPKGTMMYRFFLTTITSHFEKSKIMGMDKVWNNMVNRYYCSINENGDYDAYWMKKEKLDDLCETTKKRLRIMIGETPPNLILPDSTNKNWYNLYKIDADYTILYFWDPDCGHCKRATPKLETLYTKKMKDRNVEIFAVGKATGEDFEHWKKFVSKNKLSFINVGVTRDLYEQAKENPYSVIPSKTTLESINYQDTYDIFSTPTVFVLDKNKKIIAKNLSVAQIEHLLDDLQEGHKDDKKLFELEEDEIK